MKLKTLLVGLLWLMFCSLSVASAKQTLFQLGTHPFYRPPLASEQDLLDMVANEKDNIKKGFEKAGYGALADPFIAQAPNAEITTVQIQKGEKIIWMLYKKNGKNSVRVTRDVTWGGKEPIMAFQIPVDVDGKRYTFVVPHVCGNISLLQIGEVPQAPKPEPVVQAPPPNQAPTCQAAIAPTELMCGQTVTIDPTGSSDADGSIVAVTVAMVDASGQELASQTFEGPPAVVEMTVPCGTTSVNVTVTDDQGLQATGPDCQTGISALRPGRPLVDIGFFRQFDPANYALGRVGYEYRFTPRFSILGAVGGALQLGDNREGDDALIADLLFNYRYDKFFTGLGLGGWWNSDDSQLDGIFDMGVRLFGDPEAFNTSLFFEVRSELDEIDDVLKYGRWGLGLRFQF